MNRKTNKELRSREYLTSEEVQKLRIGAKINCRYPKRDDTLIFIMFRHALRVIEVINLKWEQVDLEKGLLHVTRAKRGVASTHPLGGKEIRMLRNLKNKFNSPYIFINERRMPLSERTIYYIVQRAAKHASFDFPIHPHMLRHSTGFYLVNKGIDTRSIQVYMGHSDIKSTAIYTELNVNRFNNFWDN